MASIQVEIVDSMSKCDRVLHHLKREPYLAVDGEGVNLSKTGPLTLLQIGTKDGKVYLFDVLTERRMLDTGGLKSILESETIVKVMHSSKNDATALYWQFDVKLHNVFDTQLACMELQRAKGRRLPSRMKLAEVCRLYCPQKADLLEEKEDVQTHWSKNEGEFWANRPMTQEMIDYASQDVLVLIPEVYMAIKREVETRGLTSQLTTQTCLDIEGTINREVKERIEKEEDAMVLEILQNFARTTRPPDRLSDITDEDVLDAITRLRSDRLATEGLPPNIRSLKVQSLTSKVEEIRTELDEKGDSIKPSGNLYGVLFRSICHSGDDALIQLARGIESRLDKILLKDMERKYTKQTPIQHIADFEKRVLDRCLHPQGENDPAVTPVLLRLYWLLQEENLDSSMQQFHDNRPAFRINTGYVKKLRYFIVGRGVPSRLQTKAQSFMRELEAARLVVRPPRR